MREKFYEIWNTFLDFLFPKDKQVIDLENLAKNRQLNLPNVLETPFSFINCLWSYRDRQVRALVWAIKYRENRVLTKYVGELIYEQIIDEMGDKILFENAEKAILIPIPAYQKKLRLKGFNQTENIASAIKEFDVNNILTLRSEVLIKHKDTLPQSKLPRSKRLINLVGTFSIEKPEEVVKKNVILIDDVTTTGSTLNEARKTLESAGAKKVIAFTIAH